jgi:hypothetical protein
MAKSQPQRPSAGSTGSTAPCASQPCPPPQGSVLSGAKANSLFQDLASQPQIPFDYPDDCCYSRAHEMCRIMRERGIQCRKIWNYAHDFSTGGASLRADTPNHPSGHVSWRYHVAPVVKVRGNDGVVRDMVMDPSLFDRPVTVDEWIAAQHDPMSTHEITDDQYFYREPGNARAVRDQNYQETNRTLADHRYARDLRRASSR